MTHGETVNSTSFKDTTMDKKRLQSWRIFTITITGMALIGGYLIGTLSTNIDHHESWQQGYQAGIEAMTP